LAGGGRRVGIRWINGGNVTPTALNTVPVFRRGSLGSPAICVLVPALSGMEDSLSQEREARAAIHRPLQHFEPVDLSFGRACGPWQVESGLHRVEVAAQADGKRGERREISGGQHIDQDLLPVVPKQASQPFCNCDGSRKRRGVEHQLCGALVHIQDGGRGDPAREPLCNDALATNGDRASCLKHPIQSRDADGCLGLLGGEAACSQPRSDQCLVSAHRRFDQ